MRQPITVHHVYSARINGHWHCPAGSVHSDYDTTQAAHCSSRIDRWVKCECMMRGIPGPASAHRGGEGHWRGAEGGGELQWRQEEGEGGLIWRAGGWEERTGWSSSGAPALRSSPCRPPTLPASPQANTLSNISHIAPNLTHQQTQLPTLQQQALD